jgi:hypothetical protein
MPDERLSRGGPEALARLLFKYVRDHTLARRIVGWAPLFDRVAADPASWQALEHIVEYLLKVRELDTHTLDRLTERIMNAQLKRTFKTTADHLRQEGEARGFARGRAEGEARGRAEGEARGRAEGEARGRAEGEARGRAEDILRILAARQVPVPEERALEVRACRDIATLDRWFARAIHAATVEDLFRDD